MEISARAVAVQDILPWRDLYRHEMNCQIIHDSLHSRHGWTISYLLTIGDATAGYGSVAIGGPWKGKAAVFEFYLLPQYHHRSFDLFQILLEVCAAPMIEIQSNDPFIFPMIHAFAQNIVSESILFHDKLTTSLSVPGAHFRPITPNDADALNSQDLDANADWVVEIDGTIAAAGGILFHYNRPYGDIYMKVADPFLKRGLGSYLVQELKRIAYQTGNIPAARCNIKNIPSRKTLQKAGFIPCGHILTGSVSL